MKKIVCSTAVILLIAAAAHAVPVRIAASLPDLASIAAAVGGDKVEVFSIARSNNNPHFVEVLPSYMIKVSHSAVYLKAGLALDQWADQIIDGSRNNRLLVVDCSEGVTVLQKPAGRVDASMGDVHSQGNPHYWLDPSNGVVIAGNVLSALKKIDPSNAGYYDANYAQFKAETEKRIAAWKGKMAKFAGRKILSYHSSWVYFANAFELAIAGNVEPLPGIPPTGKHLAGLVDTITRDHVAILLQELYFPDDGPQFLARQTGIRVLKLSPSCSEVKEDSYFRHFDEIIDQITK